MFKKWYVTAENIELTIVKPLKFIMLLTMEHS